MGTTIDRRASGPRAFRPLLLQPSFFCVRRPVTLASAELMPVLVHPVEHTLGWASEPSAGECGPARAAELGALMGCTRAAILEETVNGRTTGELAERLGISAAAASRHTAVLRRSGLVLSMRRGKRVLHTITPEGLGLLGSPHAAPVEARSRGINGGRVRRCGRG